jgi:hypothetical protein
MLANRQSDDDDQDICSNESVGGQIPRHRQCCFLSRALSVEKMGFSR